MNVNRHFCVSALGLLSVLIVFLSLTLISYRDLRNKNAALEKRLAVTPETVQTTIMNRFLEIDEDHQQFLDLLMNEIEERQRADDLMIEIQESILEVLAQKNKVDPNNPNEITTGKK